jgi:hypothetical protein
VFPVIARWQMIGTSNVKGLAPSVPDKSMKHCFSGTDLKDFVEPPFEVLAIRRTAVEVDSPAPQSFTV